MKHFCIILIAISILVMPQTSLAQSEYLLSPGDIVRITIWGYEELELNELVIRPDGRIGIPFVGDISTTGLSPQQLARSISICLQDYLAAPRVTVNILKFHTTRVYVLGEVVKPGLYELEKKPDLLAAISAAGGYTRDSAKKHVYVVKQDQKDKPSEYNLLRLLEKGDLSQNCSLSEGDTVFIAHNGRIDFAKDIVPFLTGAYVIKSFND